MASNILKKYYSEEDKLFHVIKSNPRGFSNIDKTYDTFASFYKAVKKDLSDAYLLHYDFSDIEDLNKYNFDKAVISSKVMQKIGTYNNRYEKMLQKDKESLILHNKETLDLVIPRTDVDITNSIENDEDIAVCYISDLHINHKINKKYPTTINKFELSEYLKDLVLKLKDTLPDYSFKKRILLLGDFSLNFEIFKLFFKIYRDHIASQTFFILGNHELWDKNLIKKHGNIEGMVEEYRNYLSSLDNPIILLENELYIPNNQNNILNIQEILSADINEIRRLFINNPFVIVGGIGYAGLNKKYNSDAGLYRNAPITRNDEIDRSKLIDSIHSKLKACVPDKKIFFVTHMPKEDWSSDEYVSNWYYINGHTHRNYYCDEERKHVFADNQVGYERQSFGFKFITTSSKYNIFDDFHEGIYEITREQYILFYRGLGHYIDFNRKFKTLYMIKRNDTYCFLIQIAENQSLKLLNGGTIRNIGNHDLKYFYDNLVSYSNSIKKYLASYSDFQTKISQEIKLIGGSGRIHGCIVDIDYFNHLYINPLDVSITPYFAYSITEKYVYKNLISLLKYKCNNLYLNYLNKTSTANTSALQIINNDLVENKQTTFVSDTQMYKISRILKGLQYTTKYNIVRMWNDTIISDCSKETGRIIVSGLLNPDEQKEIKKTIKKVEIKVKSKNSNETRKIINKKQKTTLSPEDKEKKQFEIYSEKVKNKTCNTIQVLFYTHSKKNATLECLLCGNKWNTNAGHFVEKQRKSVCPVCKSKIIKK